MKKLLVILLLFFPVHGAWAEEHTGEGLTFEELGADELLNLICIYDTVVSSEGRSNTRQQIAYQINLTKELNGEWPVKITQNTIQSNEIVIKNDVAVVRQTIFDRKTGSVTTQLSDETDIVIAAKNLHNIDALPKGAFLYGSCEKTSGKNKF